MQVSCAGRSLLAMKAITFAQAGGPEVLRLEDVPDPQPGAGEILVRVRGTAVNRADLMQRKGLYPPPPGASDILGLEAVGEVEVVPDPEAALTRARFRTGSAGAVVIAGSLTLLAALDN